MPDQRGAPRPAQAAQTAAEHQRADRQEKGKSKATETSTDRPATDEGKERLAGNLLPIPPAPSKTTQEARAREHARTQLHTTHHTNGAYQVRLTCGPNPPITGDLGQACQPPCGTCGGHAALTCTSHLIGRTCGTYGTCAAVTCSPAHLLTCRQAHGYAAAPRAGQFRARLGQHCAHACMDGCAAREACASHNVYTNDISCSVHWPWVRIVRAHRVPAVFVFRWPCPGLIISPFVCYAHHAAVSTRTLLPLCCVGDPRVMCCSSLLGVDYP